MRFGSPQFSLGRELSFGGSASPPNPQTSARYWRVEVQVSGVYGSVTSIASFEGRAVIGGSNIVTSGMVTASSTYDANSLPEKMFDADTETYWSSGIGTYGYGDYLDIDLGNPSTFAELSIQARSGGASDQCPLVVYVYSSDDGVNYIFEWDAHLSARPTSSGVYVLSADVLGDDAAYRYARVTVLRNTDLSSAVSSSVSIADFELRGSLGGADMIGGGSILASTDQWGAAVNAIDGDLSTIWGSANPSMYQHLTYDFGSGNAHSVNEVMITARSGGYAYQAPAGIILSYSSDGITFVDKWVSDITKSQWSSNETRLFSAKVHTIG